MAQNWHNEYADRKNGRKPVTFDHADLEEILGPTYGLMIYQEQLMRVSQKLAGYSLEEADNLRKATGKKIRELIAKERVEVRRGLRAQRPLARVRRDATSTRSSRSPTTRSTSRTPSATAYITYQTAWLKANYPVQYLAALLTSVKTNLDKAAVYLNECRQLDIPVLVPDVNASISDFACELGERNAIRFGLSAVRNVGEGVAALLIAERDANGPFTDFYDFCERVDPDRAQQAHDRVADQRRARSTRSVIRARDCCTVFEQVVDAALRRRRERDAGTMSLFDLGGDGGGDAPVFDDRLAIPDLEFDKSERLRAEKEMLGLYVSDHPLMGAERALRRLRRVPDRRARRDSTTARCAPSPASSPRLQRKYTKRGDLMATFVLEDLARRDRGDGVPEDDAEYGELLAPDAIVMVKGRVDGREDTPKLMAMEITRPEIHIDSGPPVRLRVKVGVAHRRQGRAAARDPRRQSRRQPGVAHARRARQGNRCCASATSSAATRATASSPSSASSSAPTASPSRPPTTVLCRPFATRRG